MSNQNTESVKSLIVKDNEGDLDLLPHTFNHTRLSHIGQMSNQNPEPIKILIIEDNKSDLYLLQNTLKKSGLNYTSQVVETLKSYKSALRNFKPHIILSDYELPAFNGLIAFRTKQEMFPDIPFIIVSGTIGETNAVELIKSGVNDYVLKENLISLPLRIKRALKEAAAAELLITNERRFRALIEHSTDMTCITTPEGKVLYVSPSTSKILGYTVEEFLNLSIFAIIHPEDEITPDQLDTLFASESSSVALQQRMLHRAGNWIWVEGTITNMLHEPGIKALVSNFRDISERKDAEEKINANEKRFRAMIEKSADMITLATATGELLYASPSVAKVLGYTIEEFVNTPAAGLIHPDDIPGVFENIGQILQAESKSFYSQHRLKHKSGNWVWCEGTMTNLLHEAGVNALVSNFRDITENKIAQLQLSLSETHLKEAQHLAKMGSWNYDIKGDKLTWSEELYNVFDTDKEAFRETHGSFLYLIDEDDREVALKTSRHTQKTGEPFTLVYRITTSKGDKKIIQEHGHGIKDDNGNIVRLFGTAQDITERIRSEEGNMFKADLLNTIGQAVITTDLDGIITYWNKAAVELYGWEVGEAVGQNIVDVTPSEQTKEQSIRIMQEMVNGGSWSGELELQRKDNTRFMALITNSPVYDQSQKLIGVIGVSSDITERKKGEEKLLKSEAELNEAQSIGHIGNWSIDLADSTHTWSKEMCKIFGVPDITKPSEELFLSFVHPEDKVMVNTAMVKAFTNYGNASFDFRFIRKDGELRYGHSDYRLEFDKNEKPVRLYGIVQDVTEINEAQNKIAQSEKHTRALIENITDAIILMNENSEIIYQSPSVKRISGFSVEDAKGKNALEFFHPDDVQDCLKFFQDVYTTPGVSRQNQYRILHKKGHYIWVEGTIVNLLHDENVKAFIVNYRDITERKLVQEKLDNTLVELEDRVGERTKELTDKNKNITDSINYAKRIQVGLLSPHSQLVKLFSKSFILSEPQNIVSGDFFWCYQRNNKQIIVVVDCTGHGVPGALMSIIGNNLLNGIIVDEHIDNPSEILQLLDVRLKKALKGDKGEIKDGMDIAMCVVDTYFNEVYFAGAYRPLFISDKSGKVSELAGNSCSIGGGMGEINKEFETKRFPITPGQRIYLTSDGYYSQFGGPLGKKFMKKRFRETLEALQAYPIEEHKNRLQQVFTEWTGVNEQVDDIMVVGIEL